MGETIKSAKTLTKRNRKDVWPKVFVQKNYF
jgi:hypothetical protein